MDNINQLSALIWSVADDVLRGIFKKTDYGKVILPFVVMRRLDCVLEPHKEKTQEIINKYKDKLKDEAMQAKIRKETNTTFYNSSDFDLSLLLDDPNNITSNLQNYIDGYSNNVSDIIEKFKIDPLIEEINNHDSLYLLIEKFTSIDLHPNVVDNHKMGSVYEELLRRFSETANEESGDYFTPRDVVQLLVAIVFSGEEEKLKGKGKIRKIYDPCCGTGGMLTLGKEWVHENINSDIKMKLYGQEREASTYAICKSDLLMLGEDESNIHGPCSSLSKDCLSGDKFDYMITNPPYGVNWKKEEKFIKEEANSYGGRFQAGIPRISDGSLLFLQHLMHKMQPKGSRIGIVLNGSPLFTGDAGSGESEIRKYIIENDLLESIIRLPDNMFFNTTITTYIWIVTNKKAANRKGNIQLINASSFFTPRKKNLGDKSRDISNAQVQEILQIYQNFKENEHCQIHPNSFFGYTRVTIEQPLVERGETQKDKKGQIKPDPKKRDHERIPLNDDIADFFQREVKPHLPDAWMDRQKGKIGYEINFTKYFHTFIGGRSLKEISKQLKSLDNQLNTLSKEIIHV